MISSIITRQLPPDLTLPDGYTPYTPGLEPTSFDEIQYTPGLEPTLFEEIQSSIVGESGLYGGATMNWQQDGQFKWYLGCNARRNDIFQFRIFELIGDVLVEVSLPETGSGRGWMDFAADGYLYYAAWEGSSIRPRSGPGRVPGAVPVVFGEPGPPGPPGPAGAGGRVAAPGGLLISPTYNGQLMSGGQWIDMVATFGVPAGCTSYDVRFVAQADRPNVRARLGTGIAPTILTVNTQVADVQVHDGGSVNATTDGQLWLSIVDKAGQPASANVWIQVKGWWI